MTLRFVMNVYIYCCSIGFKIDSFKTTLDCVGQKKLEKES